MKLFVRFISFLALAMHLSMGQTNPKVPSLFPRKHFSWQRNVMDEIVRERAFAVDNGNVQAVALISNDPQLGEAQMFGSVSVYDFSSAKPVAAIKPYFQGQPCFILPPPTSDFNTTLNSLTDRNGGTSNTTGAAIDLTAGDFPITGRERNQLFTANPVLTRLCGRQPIFKVTRPDPLAYDPYLAAESEQLTFTVLTLDSLVTITFTWEAATR